MYLMGGGSKMLHVVVSCYFNLYRGGLGGGGVYTSFFVFFNSSGLNQLKTLLFDRPTLIVLQYFK